MLERFLRTAIRVRTEIVDGGVQSVLATVLHADSGSRIAVRLDAYV